MSKGNKVLVIVGIVLATLFVGIYIAFQVVAKPLIESLGERAEAMGKEAMEDARKNDEKTFALIVGEWEEKDGTRWTFTADSVMVRGEEEWKFDLLAGLITTNKGRNIFSVIPKGPSTINLVNVKTEAGFWENYGKGPEILELYQVEQ